MLYWRSVDSNMNLDSDAKATWTLEPQGLGRELGLSGLDHTTDLLWRWLWMCFVSTWQLTCGGTTCWNSPSTVRWFCLSSWMSNARFDPSFFNSDVFLCFRPPIWAKEAICNPLVMSVRPSVRPSVRMLSVIMCDYIYINLYSPKIR